MDEPLKQRLVGAIVVIALGVIFLPIILDGGKYAELRKIHIKIPPAPEVDYASSIESLAARAGPDLPIAKKPSAEAIISRPEKSEPDRPDGTERKHPLPVPQAETATTEPVQPAKALKEIPGNNENNLAEKAQATAVKPPTLKSDPISQAKLVQKPGPSEQKKITSPGAAWVIQVGSFSNRTRALELRDKLRKSGFTSFVESFESVEKASHRVRIGPETEHSRAEEALSRLKSKLAMDGIIVSYP